ncbi:hypothetical protein DUI87_22350 [Hirundo rustica rustica]|uniref:Uncharacterized protein n=1 Tax=Hirundo rustica rustica TaxID=333673 RepID=A0A3M0JPV2_HIRRU|nr:hypothetical protein DUI87_22350 [Hirundo rustica rustica]
MEKAKPSCWGNHGGQDTTTSCRSLAAAPHRTSSRDANTMYRSRIPVRVSSLVSTGIQRPSQQPAATQGQAHSRPVTAPSGKQDPERAIAPPGGEHQQHASARPWEEREGSECRLPDRAFSRAEDQHTGKPPCIPGGLREVQENVFLYQSPVWSLLACRDPDSSQEPGRTRHTACLCQLP